MRRRTGQAGRRNQVDRESCFWNLLILEVCRFYEKATEIITLLSHSWKSVTSWSLSTGNFSSSSCETSYSRSFRYPSQEGTSQVTFQVPRPSSFGFSVAFTAFEVHFPLRKFLASNCSFIADGPGESSKAFIRALNIGNALIRYGSQSFQGRC